jgi:hypothetical protein
MQTEKKGFTKREKVLLILLVIIGFTALMVMYVIIPFNNHLQDETDRYHALSIEQMQINSLLASAPHIRQRHTNAINNFEEARERYYNEAHISEVGRMMVNLCAQHNLASVSQSLSEPTIPDQWDAFKVMGVHMTLSGMYYDFMRLLDTIENTEYLRITSLSFSVGEMLSRINVNFEVIMMQALEE